MSQQPHDPPPVTAELDRVVTEAADAAIADVRRLGVSESQLSDAEIVDLLSETLTAQLEGK